MKADLDLLNDDQRSVMNLLFGLHVSETDPFFSALEMVRHVDLAESDAHESIGLAVQTLVLSVVHDSLGCQPLGWTLHEQTDEDGKDWVILGVLRLKQKAAA